jgi:hypothetical protein
VHQAVLDLAVVDLLAAFGYAVLYLPSRIPIFQAKYHGEFDGSLYM